MDPAQPLCAALLEKIHEQIDRTSHLIVLLPDGRLDWTPPIPGAWPVATLLGHLLDCFAGLCAVLAAAAPDRLAHFSQLRELPVNACTPGEALDRISLYRTHIDDGFAHLHDSDLARTIPTVFVAHGEPLLTLLLGNLEHLINHKHQLFTCLKQMGVSVNTGDLYRFRGVE